MIPHRLTIPSILRWFFGRRPNFNLDAQATGDMVRAGTEGCKLPSTETHLRPVRSAASLASFLRRNPLGLRPGSSSANKVVHTRRRRILGTALRRMK